MKSIREQGREFGKKINDAEVLAAIMFVAEAQKDDSALDSITVIEHAELFPVWDGNFTGRRGDIVNDSISTGVYRLREDMPKPEAKNRPSPTDRKWELLGYRDAIYPEWSKPIGRKDAYQSGDRVMFKGVKYVSGTDANMSEPDNAGWVISN